MEQAPATRKRSVLRLWFGFTEPVSRRAYLATGLALAVVKYLVELAIVHALTGRIWTPVDYLIPSAIIRFGHESSRWLALSLFVWSLPFVWIGASMTARRAIDAGHSGALALLFFVPVVNDLFMLLLATLPTRSRSGAASVTAERAQSGLRSATLAVLVGTAVIVANVAFSTLLLRSYSAPLFIGTPFVVGFVAAALFNRDRTRGVGATLSVTVGAVTAAAGVILLLAMEGAVCLLMVYPLAVFLAVAGAGVGRMVALKGHRSIAPLVALFLGLPGLMGVAGRRPEAPLPINEVQSAVEVDAPPEVVWHSVIAFASLPPPTELLFRAGIAYPIRAQIDGAGVGAVRRCEFSTGAFVEPITTWDPPRRLSFDVTAEPPGMRETSPYETVHAPHVSGYLRSRRGEFRLTPLPRGRTRLEGSTFYTLEVLPTWYWAPIADAIIHRIHLRVLRHIKTLSER
jgi:uncharacterized membrane protein YhaH (DUF805 family)